MNEESSREREGLSSNQKWRATLQRSPIQRLKKKALRKMMNWKADGLDLPAVWKSLAGEVVGISE